MSRTCAPWVVAQPTSAEERIRHPISDPALHEVLARSQAGRDRLAGIVLGERLARTRGSGGRTVSHAWADAGVPVAVVPDPDPRTQSQRRQLLVDDRTAVLAWGGRMRELGAKLAWWSVTVDAPAPPISCVDALVTAGLRPMLRVAVSLTPDTSGTLGLSDFLDSIAEGAFDLADVVLCVPGTPARSTPPGEVGAAVAERFVSTLVSAIPERARGVVVTPDSAGGLVGGPDAAAFARSLVSAGVPWPVSFSAGGLPFRRAADYWPVPELAAEAPARFDAVLDRLHRARSEPLTGTRAQGDVSAALPPDDAPPRRSRFDSTLLRSRSLYSSRPPALP